MVLLQDVRYALRTLSKSPGFTAAALLTLALGIGANTAIFSLVNSVLLRPLPFPQSGQLVVIFGKSSEGQPTYVSRPNLEDWRRMSHSFSSIAGFNSQTMNVTGRDQPSRVRGGMVTSDFFSTLGVRCMAGRAFLPGEDAPNGPRVAIVSYGFWQDQMGGMQDAIGKNLVLNNEDYSVVGILPQGFEFPWAKIDIWVPISRHPSYSMDRADAIAVGIGRLKSGVSVEQAGTEMNGIVLTLAQEYPASNRDAGATVQGLQEFLVKRLRPSLLVLTAVVAFVLLIACANVANLMLARSLGRQHEISVRAAMGASRGRIVRQLLTESVLLACAGGVLGILLAMWSTDAMAAARADDLPAGVAVSMDPRALAFTLAISLVTGIAFGLAPVFQLRETVWNSSLRRRGNIADASGRARSLLVAGQVALALVLLVGSGLMIKSFSLLSHVDPGFNPKNLLTLEYRLPRNKYPHGEEQTLFHQQVTERVRALPGVRNAATALAIPFSGNEGPEPFLLLDRAPFPPGKEPQARYNAVDPEFFATLRIPLIQGREFSAADTLGSPRVILIDRTMAARFWPQQNPIGTSLHLLSHDITGKIVGVIGNAKYDALDETTSAQVYVPRAQDPAIFSTLIVRTAGDPESMVRAVEGALWSVDKDQPMWKVRSMDWLVAHSVSDRRFLMTLLSGFSALALILAGIGIYGVISYSVRQRTPELGIRVAMGALPRDILTLVMRQGLRMVLIGLIGGVIGSFALTRLLGGMLYEVRATDPSVYALISASLAAVALAAAYIPARRATRVDPMVALRYE